MDDLYLTHHGIKGQKWGVRRYQNADGSLTEAGKKRYSSDRIIAKGTTLHRITNDKEKNLRNGFYASYKPEDNKKYRDKYGEILNKQGKNPVDKVLEASKDIKIPSKKNAINMMKNALDNAKIYENSSNLKRYLQNDISKENNDSDKLYRRAIKELDDYVSTGKVGNNLYDALNVAHADKNSTLINSISKNYYSELSKNGYGAFMDINDIRYGAMKTKAPIIISDASNVRLVAIKKVK